MLARREVIKGLATGVASLPLARVLADPRLARAAAENLSTLTLKTAGGQSVHAALAEPERKPTSTVLLVHEWWGLNDQIKAVAADLAKQGYWALAVDLYGGKVTSDPEDARAYMNEVDPLKAKDTLSSWIDWLRGHEGVTGKLGTVGWCFGGGWSLNASLIRPVDATVVYYGDVAKSAADLAALSGPVLGHFATQDGWITRDMVSGFERQMSKAGKTLTSHWYEAQHAFANPTAGRYDEEDADLAWSRTLAFFSANL